MLELNNITKKFDKESVLDGVSLTIRKGEIHGLAGLNGSGKSTLLNILFGSRTITETGGFKGSYLLDKRLCSFSHPSQAVKYGIGMVHQEQALIPNLSVAENIQINREPVYSFLNTILPRAVTPINRAMMSHVAAKALHKIGIRGYEKETVSSLTLNIKQFIEIARELSRQDLKLLLLDEPTAVFSSEDVGRLQAALKALAQKGTAILFVSHRIEEIASTCDRATVLRDGRVSARLEGCDLSVKAITSAMIPHEVIKTRKTPVKSTSSPKISIRNFNVPMPGDELRNVDLDIYPSEIFGLTGLSGCGKNSLGYGVMGLYQSTGTMFLAGKNLSIQSPRQMLCAGFFFLPEERHRLGLLLNKSIQENIAFSSLHTRDRFRIRSKLLGRIFPDGKAISDHAGQCIRKFSISCNDSRQKVAELSGGNQQKVSLAHAITLAPSVLFINEPTRGVDVAAKETILDHLISTCKQHGTTLIISSSELDELRRICDRIGILYKGKLQAILSPTADEALFAGTMMGERKSVS